MTVTCNVICGQIDHQNRKYIPICQLCVLFVFVLFIRLSLQLNLRNAFSLMLTLHL